MLAVLGFDLSLKQSMQATRRAEAASARASRAGRSSALTVSALLAPNVPAMPALPQNEGGGKRRVIIIGQASKAAVVHDLRAACNAASPKLRN